MRFISCLILSAALVHAGIHFEPNRGQADARFAFVARTLGGLIGPGARSIEFAKPGGEQASIRFEHVSSRAGVEGVERLPSVSHYAQGSDPSRWLWGVPHYERAQVSHLYPGVDLLFRSSGRSVEFDFQVAPGADVSQIRLRFSAPARLMDSGELAFGPIRLHAPQAWQIVQGRRVPADVRFALDRKNRASFQLARYDRSRTLTIDPVVDFATYLGGSNNDGNPLIVAAPDGAIYMAGNTFSTDFPAFPPENSLLNRPEVFLQSTVFVSRFKQDASSLDWSLFIGGTAQQQTLGLKRDGLGNIYLLGKTTSPNLPVTPGAYRTHIASLGTDFFVMKLDGATGQILASTFLGISQSPSLGNISAVLAVDFAGGIYVGAGLPADFSPTPGALQTKPTAYDAWGCILRLNSVATAVVYATYWPLGGINVMDVDASGNLVLAGQTGGISPPPPFPAVNPLPGVNQNPEYASAAYVAILSPQGSTISFASLLDGGSRGSAVNDLKLGVDGSIHIAGYTASTSFPQVSPLELEPLPANYPPPDGIWPSPFLVKLAPGGAGFLQSTLLFGPQYTPPAGSGFGGIQKLALLPDGSPCLTGVGASAFQQTPGGLVGITPTNTSPQYGWTVACVDVAGTSFGLKTGLPYVGNPFGDFAVSPDGALLFAGTALSGAFTTPGVVQPVFGGYAQVSSDYPPLIVPEGDAYLMRVSLVNPAPALSFVSPASMFLNAAVTGTTTLQLYGFGFAYGTAVEFNGQPVDSVFVNSNQITIPSIDLASIQRSSNPVGISLVGPGGGASSATFTGINASPGNASVSPSAVTQGAAETKLVVRASNLTSDSLLYWNGQIRTANFAQDPPGKAGHFELLLEPADLARPVVAQITVGNPGPGGGMSTPAAFVVQPSSGDVVPVLYAPSNLIGYGGRYGAPGPSIDFGGSGFSSNTRAFWDGIEAPASLVSATDLKIAPPAADLQRWGSHTVYVQNGSYKSAVVNAVVARSVTLGLAAVDLAHQRVYVLTSGGYGEASDLLTLDMSTGAVLNTVTAIVSSAIHLAMSVDGQYLYLDDFVSSSDGTSRTWLIRRYNCAAAKVDLVWQPMSASEMSTAGSINGLLAVAGAPETLIVQTSNTTLATRNFFRMFDRDKPRPVDSATLGLDVEGDVFFATGERIYYGAPLVYGAVCWQWVNYDASGITSGQTQCSSSAPDAVYDHGFTYLTDGVRIYGIAMPAQTAPQYVCSTTATGLVADLARRHVYGVQSSCGSNSGPVLDYSLDTQQIQTKTPYTLPKLWLTSSGGLLAANGSYITVVP